LDHDVDELRCRLANGFGEVAGERGRVVAALGGLAGLHHGSVEGEHRDALIGPGGGRKVEALRDSRRKVGVGGQGATVAGAAPLAVRR